MQQAWGIANFNYCFVWIRFFWTSYSLYKTATTLHDNFISILTFWFLNSICHSIWKHYLDFFFFYFYHKNFLFSDKQRWPIFKFPVPPSIENYLHAGVHNYKWVPVDCFAMKLYYTPTFLGELFEQRKGLGNGRPYQNLFI